MRRSDAPRRLDARGWLAFAWALAVLIAWSVAMVRARPAAFEGLLGRAGVRIRLPRPPQAESPVPRGSTALADSSSRLRH